MQLQFKLDDKSELDLKLEAMQQSIDAMKESNSKVRRGLFARHGEVSKAVLDLLTRVEELETEVRRLKRHVQDQETTEWLYKTDGCLFALAAS